MKDSEHINPPAPVILRIREIQARTGLARPTIYRLIQQQRFPAGVDLLGNGRVVGWTEESITSWINERVAAGSKTGGAGK